MSTARFTMNGRRHLVLLRGGLSSAAGTPGALDEISVSRVNGSADESPVESSDWQDFCRNIGWQPCNSEPESDFEERIAARIVAEMNVSGRAETESRRAPWPVAGIRDTPPLATVSSGLFLLGEGLASRADFGEGSIDADRRLGRARRIGIGVGWFAAAAAGLLVASTIVSSSLHPASKSLPVSCSDLVRPEVLVSPRASDASDEKPKIGPSPAPLRSVDVAPELRAPDQRAPKPQSPKTLSPKPHSPKAPIDPSPTQIEAPPPAPPGSLVTELVAELVAEAQPSSESSHAVYSRGVFSRDVFSRAVSSRSDVASRGSTSGFIGGSQLEIGTGSHVRGTWPASAFATSERSQPIDTSLRSSRPLVAEKLTLRSRESEMRLATRDAPGGDPSIRHMPIAALSSLGERSANWSFAPANDRWVGMSTPSTPTAAPPSIGVMAQLDLGIAFGRLSKL
jgi:hypothetical protein